jgi:serine/tyrosine/threonine adenylyltransferase
MTTPLFNFNNTFSTLSPFFYTPTTPIPVQNPSFIFLNTELADNLNISSELLRTDLGVSILSGNSIPTGSTPISMAYSGHQFGYFSELLGDGRAVLLGEILSKHNDRYDIQLKGSGRTPYSRRGDGRSSLGPVLREYIVSEAMYSLGIPTTRALAVVKTGETVQRETPLPGGILTRVSKSHIRVGTFEYVAAHGTYDDLKELSDYCINRYYSHLNTSKTPYLDFFTHVIDAQAKLIAKWMSIGFIHGVMNTDNTSIIEQTIDYGPCAFMDTYNPDTVFSYIDSEGRYAYKNQPHIMHWNLSCLAGTLAPLFSDDMDTAISIAKSALESFWINYNHYWQKEMNKKIGLSTSKDEDNNLIQTLLGLMKRTASDFTLSFRELSSTKKTQPLFQDKDFPKWEINWNNRLNEDLLSKNEQIKLMNKTNPLIIPRNHIIENTLNDAIKRFNFTELETLHTCLKTPYLVQKNTDKYTQPPKSTETIDYTYCGT